MKPPALCPSTRNPWSWAPLARSGQVWGREPAQPPLRGVWLGSCWASSWRLSLEPRGCVRLNPQALGAPRLAGGLIRPKGGSRRGEELIPYPGPTAAPTSCQPCLPCALRWRTGLLWPLQLQTGHCTEETGIVLFVDGMGDMEADVTVDQSVDVIYRL